jgi:hypothetical protein
VKLRLATVLTVSVIYVTGNNTVIISNRPSYFTRVLIMKVD